MAYKRGFKSRRYGRRFGKRRIKRHNSYRISRGGIRL